jgi:hypothetical protein
VCSLRSLRATADAQRKIEEAIAQENVNANYEQAMEARTYPLLIKLTSSN